MPARPSTSFGALALLLAGRVVADNSGIQCTLKANPPAGAVCGIKGYLTNENSLDSYTLDPQYTTPDGCALSCLERPNCVSYYLGDSSYPFCEWHTDIVANAGFYAYSSSYYYAYDQACWTCGPKTVTCPASDGQQFTVGAATFNIHCGGDHYGGDLSFLTTDTFEECMTTCASTVGCIDVAYNGNSCYMKSSIQSPRQNDAVWGAVLASADKKVGTPIACPTDNGTTYVASSGANFIVQCGVDYYGGDMGSSYVNSFAECVQDCDSTAGCVDVALHGNYCYMKNTVTSPSQNSDVWGAILSTAVVRRDDEALAPTKKNTPGLKRKRDVAPTSKNTPNVDDVQANAS